MENSQSNNKTTNHSNIDLDDLNIDNIGQDIEKDFLLNEEKNNTQLESYHIDLDDFDDINIDDLSNDDMELTTNQDPKPHDHQNTPIPEAEPTEPADVHATIDTQTELDTEITEATSNNTQDIDTQNVIEQMAYDQQHQDETTIAAPLPAAHKKNKLKFGFGKKAQQKAPNTSSSPSYLKNSNDKKAINKKAIMLIILLLIIILAIIAYFISNHSLPNNPSTQQTQEETVQEVAPTVAETSTQTEETNNSIEEAHTEGSQNQDEATGVIETEVPYINPEDILNANIPEDTALVKEEIDRLADQNQKLAEQEKLLNEQITMMDELTDKKAEHIELLEKQIAQLEAQKAQQE